ncbi:MAG: RNA methyltransferase [Candidatus Nitrohelix vancouverensis]|uniref:RNA methyltransferase n=1 Tax=Candidatus Nitrohelix vancouverensis TaxID=2705534 RepID=A0A7T0C0V9_9BACT|nr:MAG: RNA methyltransferase [Candidatus Nitrohelix vancouverensis]
MSAFKKRPGDMLRVFFSPARAVQMEPVKRYCRDHKLPYKKIPPEELNKVAASVHHEGVVIVLKPVKPESAYSLIRRPLGRNTLLAALDSVSNTHNLGAILRTCAFFGVEGLLVGDSEGQAALSSSAARMAEGALETTPLYQASDLPSALRDLKEKGFYIIGTDANSGVSLYDAKIKFPCVAVFGNEGAGISDRTLKRCDAVVHIPSFSPVESLNVSVAAGVTLSELRRRGSQKK